MRNSYRNTHFRKSIIIAFAILFSAVSCKNDDTGIHPYSGSPGMSKITVEAGSFKPKISWSGGFVSVVGVNKGSVAKLDQSLIWLIKSNNDDIRYPVTFGTAPSGTENLLSQFGGSALSKLDEDFIYTYWVLKGKSWDQISKLAGKILKADAQLAPDTYSLAGDTVKISSDSFTLLEKQIDLFPNIKDLQQFGQLGKIQIVQAVDESGPKISWKITESGVSDSLLSAIGIVMGQRYSATNQIWEVWSEENGTSGKIYGKKNMIAGPLYAGAAFAGTKVFQTYPEEGLIRNKDYYIWIGRANWDGKTHTRVAKGYAYAYFRTW